MPLMIQKASPPSLWKVRSNTPSVACTPLIVAVVGVLAGTVRSLTPNTPSA